MAPSLRYDAAMFAIAPTLRLCLALVLALTSVQMTVARGQGGSIAAWVEICAGAEVTTIALDPGGKPAPPHVPCPDCIIAAAVVLPPVLQMALPRLLATRVARSADAPRTWSGPSLTPAARGPPAFA